MPNPLDLSSIAATGAHIDISSEFHRPFDLAGLLDIVVRNGGHLTISGKGFTPLELSGLAAKGKQHLTIKW